MLTGFLIKPRSLDYFCMLRTLELEVMNVAVNHLIHVTHS